MENPSKAIKFVNNDFHIVKTHNHIPGTFWILLVYFDEVKFVMDIFRQILLGWWNQSVLDGRDMN
jgi:hypothetical protein